MHCNLKWLQLQFLKNIPLKPPVGLLPVTENPTAIECLLEAAAALILNIRDKLGRDKNRRDERVIKLSWSVISCHCLPHRHICHSLVKNLQTVGEVRPPETRLNIHQCLSDHESTLHFIVIASHFS